MLEDLRAQLQLRVLDFDRRIIIDNLFLKTIFYFLSISAVLPSRFRDIIILFDDRRNLIAIAVVVELLVMRILVIARIRKTLDSFPQSHQGLLFEGHSR